MHWVFGRLYNGIHGLFALGAALFIVDGRFVVDAVGLDNDDAATDYQRDRFDGLEHDRIGTDAGLASHRDAPVAVELEIRLLLDLEVIVLFDQLIPVAAVERARGVADMQMIVARDLGNVIATDFLVLRIDPADEQVAVAGDGLVTVA